MAEVFFKICLILLFCYIVGAQRHEESHHHQGPQPQLGQGPQPPYGQGPQPPQGPGPQPPRGPGPQPPQGPGPEPPRGPGPQPPYGQGPQPPYGPGPQPPYGPGPQPPYGPGPQPPYGPGPQPPQGPGPQPPYAQGPLPHADSVNDRYYPRYHLAPPYGWMNDPNGFSVFNNEYHLFYQFNPNTSQAAGIAHWGHAKSSDLYNWEHLPIAMYPDKWYDLSGVFSGSAIVENDTMYIFYTGNLNHEGAEGEEHQILATSTDGVNVTKLEENNPIINGSDRQPNFRDPKVWKYNNTYYMVLGNSFNNNTLGRVLLYSSQDMINWAEVAVLGQSNGTLGYMWECPDFFELDGKFVLLFSPQGVAAQGDKYNNLYQTGYIVGNFDYSTNVFTPTSEFKELDHGHDFYATQSLLDPQGRRLVVAWFDMWEQVYPERDDGFTGQMTVPRILRLSTDDSIIQTPLEAPMSRHHGEHSNIRPNGRTYTLRNKAGVVNVRADNSSDFQLFLEADTARVSLTYNAAAGQVSLDRGGTDGVRRTEWKPQGQLKWTIYIDASSVELFCGEGEVTFSSRFFPNGAIKVRLAQESRANKMTVRNIERNLPHGSHGNKWSITLHGG